MSNVLLPRRPLADFRLQRMEQIDQELKGKPDKAHRHEYYTIIFTIDVRGTHQIDYQTYAFAPRQVHFVSPGQVHQVLTAGKPEGFAITFATDFLIENQISQRFISNLNLFKDFGETPPLQLDTETSLRLTQVVQEMEYCLATKLRYRPHALGALLQLFLIYCNNCRLLDSTQLDEESAQVCLWRNFKDLVQENYHEWHKVGAYAEALFVSPKHLSRSIKAMTGKTAKAHLQDRLLLEAKRFLHHTDLSAKEIAFRLGFQDPLHFSAFFKKHTGLSVSVFRKTHE